MTTASDFTVGPLYKKLVEVLPIYVKDPFSAAPKLDVEKLREAASKSHEAVYKWLRKGKITPENATLLVELSNRPENVAILQTLGRTPPTITDFHDFVFGAA